MFDRHEINQIMNLYGRMVSAGQWRDYSIDFESREARFSAFRRAADRPEISIVKRPDLARKQGLYALLGEAGQTLKRGSDLKSLMAPLERRLMKLVEA
ncbi:DUF2794 domain-containing protein [Pacificimonas aurantium]|uniref:DUF2794 domain-containing protein n=1 Tax=Pacificimonas aurantium TaxID=1250540 RepID=UPI00295E41CB|nr:DUF2794 domain-containing protein [Pacificimonas aurantium]